MTAQEVSRRMDNAGMALRLRLIEVDEYLAILHDTTCQLALASDAVRAEAERAADLAVQP